MFAWFDELGKLFHSKGSKFAMEYNPSQNGQMSLDLDQMSFWPLVFNGKYMAQSRMKI